MNRILQRRRGMISFEFIAGLMLLLGTLILFLGVVSRQLKVNARLTDQRAAVRLAETTLLTLRNTGMKPATPSEVSVRRLPDTAPAGYAWVEVSASSGERSARLVGLIRQGEGK